MSVQNSRIVPADREYRLKVLVGLLFFALCCGVCFWALYGAFRGIETLAETKPAAALEELRGLVTVVSMVNALLSSVFCAWFAVRAYRTYTSERYPPPGTRVLRDTKLRTGRDARMMAVLQVVTALVILSTNGVMWFLQRIVDSLQG